MRYCTTYTSTACVGLRYEYGGNTYTCPSCTGDCNTAYYQAYTECQDAVGACSDLASCCNAMDTTYRPSCVSSYNAYIGTAYADISCKSALDSYRTSSLCP